MAWREGREIWREGPEDAQDTREMGDWERAAYACAEESALSRRDVLKLAGLGLGALLLSPVSAAGARSVPRSLEVQGSTLIIGRLAASFTLDPHKSIGETDAEIFNQIYDRLVYVDERGRVYPGLATAWSFSRNSKALTFKLRRGVTFHDGTRFDANAVKFSVDRWIDPKTASPVAGNAGPLTDVEVLEEYTVRFHYKQPYAPVLVTLAVPWSGIVGKAAVEKHGDAFGRNPVGTGAYRFVEWTGDDTIRLKRHPNHAWATPHLRAPNGRPLGRGAAIEDVEFRVIPADATRIAAFLTKEVDLISGDRAVPTNQIARLRREAGVRVVQVPARGIICMIVNATRAPLKDARSRLAISHAIDRKKLVALALAGQGRPGTSMVASSYSDYDPTARKYYTHDPERARSLLKAAGQSRGFTFDYLLAAEYVTDEDKRTSQLVQEDLAEVGIKMNIKYLPTPRYIAEFGKPFEKRAHAHWSGVQFADAGSSMKLTLHSKGGYLRHFRDPGMDPLLERQDITVDRAKRKAILSQIQHRVGSRAYVLPFYELRYTVVAHEYVRNVRSDWEGGYLYVQEMSRA